MGIIYLFNGNYLENKSYQSLYFFKRKVDYNFLNKVFRVICSIATYFQENIFNCMCLKIFGQEFKCFLVKTLKFRGN